MQNGPKVVIDRRAAQPTQGPTEARSPKAIGFLGRPVDRTQRRGDAGRSNQAAPVHVLPDAIQVEEVYDVEAGEIGIRGGRIPDGHPAGASPPPPRS